MKPLNYLRLWLACARYSMVRTMMFRADFIMWSLVELFWMAAGVLVIGVLYRQTDSIAGWNEYEMLLLFGTAMLLQRLLMGFFWSNLFEMSRNIRTGHFDFFLAQPGNPLFMVSTRKLDPDGLINSLLALGMVGYAAHHLGLHLTVGSVALYGLLVLCGLVVHYSVLLMVVSLSFWIIGAQNLEGSYFTLFEFSRLPREAFRGIARVFFVYALWLVAAALAWLGLAVLVFSRGLRQYASASS